MTIIKITNLIQQNGQADYKGLNLDTIVKGSQLYPENENVAYVKYVGAIPIHSDVSEIAQAEYDSIKQSIENSRPPSLEERIKTLEDMQLASLGI
jgi:hypothetical protein